MILFLSGIFVCMLRLWLLWDWDCILCGKNYLIFLGGTEEIGFEREDETAHSISEMLADRRP